MFDMIKNTILYWNKLEDSFLIKNYQCLPFKFIQSSLPSRSKRAIWARANLLGLHRQDKGQILRKGDVSVLFNNSTTSCYWIGFLMADGTFTGTRLTVSISEKDRIHLDKLANYLQTTIALYSHQGNSKLRIKPYNLVRISISDSSRIPRLREKYDIKFNKTYNPPSIDCLKKTFDTKEKFISFFLGFIDGDGCISLNKRGYYYIIIDNHLSWYDVHKFMIDGLQSYGFYKGKTKPVITKKRYSRIQITGIFNSLREFAKSLDLPLMERKWYQSTNKDTGLTTL